MKTLNIELENLEIALENELEEHGFDAPIVTFTSDDTVAVTSEFIMKEFYYDEMIIEKVLHAFGAKI